MIGRWLKLCVAAGLALLSMPSHSHAVLLDSSPKPGEMLMQPPNEVVANFNEGVGPIFFKVLDEKGREVGNPGEIRLDGTKMVLPLGDTLPNGTYVLTYRVISADTHPVGATFGFSVGEPMKTIATQSEAGARSPWAVAVALNRWILYAGMLWTAGAAIFLLVLGIDGALRDQTAAKARLAAVITLVTYVLSIGLGGADMQLGGFDALWSAAAWRSGLDSTLTSSAVLGVLAMLLLWSGFRSGDRCCAGDRFFPGDRSCGNGAACLVDGPDRRTAPGGDGVLVGGIVAAAAQRRGVTCCGCRTIDATILCVCHTGCNHRAVERCRYLAQTIGIAGASIRQ